MTISDGQMRQWLSGARAGSPDDLGRLMDTCRTYLLLVANQELDQLMMAKGGASDLVQETFLRAQRGFQTFKGESEKELKAWLRQILKHHLSNFRRKYMHTGKRAAKKEISIDTMVDLDTKEFALRSREPSPEDRMIVSEQTVLLNGALKRIHPAHAKIILLRHRDGLSFAEIAARTGKTTTALRKLWARAIESLQNEIGTSSKHSA